ncbi:MAG TPA: nitroreductase/quinone reductase family protein [Candidatus Acidoferrum sp.]|nr:nitroreductase/quinone reductase family protein [Candidatus Acidoferrum sp.]
MSEAKPLQIPADMNAFNQQVIADFRATGGQMTGQMAGRGILLLTTKGARSGQPRTAVLGYGRHGKRYVVIASNNGAPKAPAWYHNLLRQPKATVEVGPDRFEVRATTAKPEERDELAKSVPYLEGQQKLTSRELPLVVLEPV